MGVGAILGSGAGFVTLALWTVTAGPAAAFEAQVLGTYVGDLAPGIPHAAITYVALAAALLVALMAVRAGALVTGLFPALCGCRPSLGPARLRPEPTLARPARRARGPTRRRGARRGRSPP